MKGGVRIQGDQSIHGPARAITARSTENRRLIVPIMHVGRIPRRLTRRTVVRGAPERKRLQKIASVGFGAAQARGHVPRSAQTLRRQTAILFQRRGDDFARIRLLGETARDGDEILFRFEQRDGFFVDRGDARGERETRGENRRVRFELTRREAVAFGEVATFRDVESEEVDFGFGARETRFETIAFE